MRLSLRLAAGLLPLVVATSGAGPAGALAISLQTQAVCFDPDPVDTHGGPGIGSAQCSHSVNQGGFIRKVGSIQGDAQAKAGFRAVGVDASVDADVSTSLPVSFGASASATAQLSDAFLMDASLPDGTPVNAGFFQVNLAATGSVSFFWSGQALLSQATLSYVIAVGGVSASDTIVVLPTDLPFTPVNAFLPLTIPWQAGVPVQIDLSATATVNGTLIDDGDVDVRVQFGNTLEWLGITSVTDASGAPVGRFSAVSPDGVDWGVVPEPGAALLASLGIAALAAARAACRNP